MAPEIIYGKGYSYPIDFYTLGALLHEFLIGFPPFYDENPENILKNIKTKELKISLKLSKLMRTFLYSLLNKNPGQRTQTFEDIKAFKLFENYDWDLILEKPNPGPIAISLYSSNINDEFSNQIYRDNEPKKFRKKFESFYYLSPSSSLLFFPQTQKLRSERDFHEKFKITHVLQSSHSQEHLNSSNRIKQSMELLNSLKKSVVEKNSQERIKYKQERNFDSGFFAELRKRLENSSKSIFLISENKDLWKTFVKTESNDANTRKLFMSVLENNNLHHQGETNTRTILDEENIEKEFKDVKQAKNQNNEGIFVTSNKKLLTHESESHLLKPNISNSDFSNIVKKLKSDRSNFQKIMGSFYGKFKNSQIIKEKIINSTFENAQKTPKISNASINFNSTFRNITESSSHETHEYLLKEKPKTNLKAKTIRPNFPIHNNFTSSKLKSEVREPIINVLKNSKSSGNVLKISPLSSMELRKSLDLISNRKSPNTSISKNENRMKEMLDKLMPKKGSVDKHMDYNRNKSLKSNSSETNLKSKSIPENFRNSNSLANRLKTKNIY